MTDLRGAQKALTSEAQLDRLGAALVRAFAPVSAPAPEPTAAPEPDREWAIDRLVSGLENAVVARASGAYNREITDATPAYAEVARALATSAGAQTAPDRIADAVVRAVEGYARPAPQPRPSAPAAPPRSPARDTAPRAGRSGPEGGRRFEEAVQAGLVERQPWMDRAGMGTFHASATVFRVMCQLEDQFWDEGLSDGEAGSTETALDLANRIRRVDMVRHRVAPDVRNAVVFHRMRTGG